MSIKGYALFWLPFVILSAVAVWCLHRIARVAESVPRLRMQPTVYDGLVIDELWKGFGEVA